MIQANMRQGSDVGLPTIVATRVDEMAAFDRMPPVLQQVLRDMDVPYATVQLEGLLEKWPADVLAKHLVNERRKRADAARRRILAGEPPP